MKVYALPNEVPAPETDYRNYNREKEVARENEHMRKLAEWLRKAGYTGKRTGEIVRFGVADGYALYMLADGKKSALIHLPYGDAYNYNDVVYLPKKEILRRIDADKAMTKLFARA
jgi:hypothetical protein